jgi:hypothetical protein
MPITRSRHLKIASVAASLLAAGCATEINYPQAVCLEARGGYEITVAGKRFSLSHSLIRALIEQTYETKETFLVPKTNGLVNGADIPAKEGMYKYGGELEFSGPLVSINLHYIDTDQKKLIPLKWNGTYQLGQCKAAAQ